MSGFELQHRARQPREHHAGDARVERGEQRRHVAELLRQRLCRRPRVRTSSSVRRSSIDASDVGSSTSSARSTSDTDEKRAARDPA